MKMSMNAKGSDARHLV